MHLNNRELRALSLARQRRAASIQGTRVSPLLPHSRGWYAKKHVAQERVSKTPRRRGKGKCHADFDDEFRLAKLDGVRVIRSFLTFELANVADYVSTNTVL